MKSTITEQNKPEPLRLPLPALYRNIQYGYVVLFTDANTGTVVLGNKSINVLQDLFPLGYHATDWTCCYVESVWERCPVGTKVELEQDI